ncbi:MAG: 5'/3'-nucleotidase SurE [Christensenella sp.]|nr:5'/3'-nucleotidase SurE [Christensenella sp.]
MKILITNDDGVYAEGIVALANAMATSHEVVVVAPDRERSACARSLTVDIPLKTKKLHISAYHGCEVYSTTGTPTDCVKFGAQELLKGQVDLVLSGINIGSNLGTDIAYSGTVSAALEAETLGYPAIAFSQVLHYAKEEERHAYFLTGAQMAAEFVDKISLSDFKEYVYNVNFPPVPKDQIEGIKVCPQGICNYDEKYEKRVDPFGREYYWSCGKMNHSDYNDIHKTDIYWIRRNYVTITPVHWDTTAQNALQDVGCRIDHMKLHF